MEGEISALLTKLRSTDDIVIPGSLQGLADPKVTKSQTPPAYDLADRWTVDVTPGPKYTVTSRKDGVEPAVFDAFLQRDVVARATVTELLGKSPCAEVIGASNNAGILVEEDLGYDVLQKRILVDCKVDHGLTCELARLVANIHKKSHKESLTPERFGEISQQFVPNPATAHLGRSLFVSPYEPALISGLEPRLRTKAEGLLASQDFADGLSQLRQLQEGAGKECLVHGDLNLAGVLAKDGRVQLTDLGFAEFGPAARDLGALLAHYIIAYHSHMLTEENNDAHRRLAHDMHDAVKKTVETYTEEVGPGLVPPISDVAGFAGLELLRRALSPAGGPVRLSPSVREEVFGSGERLLTRRARADNLGRLLMIGLQLC